MKERKCSVCDRSIKNSESSYRVIGKVTNKLATSREDILLPNVCDNCYNRLFKVMQHIAHISELYIDEQE